jgi:dolichyl-diphosphooligosaccharide--protein glycosyltransferase
LLLLIILSFAVRSVWYYDAAYTGGPTPLLSGNDPDYHKRTVDYFLANHHFLQRDPLLDYPNGGPNPNPPAYSTSVALLGMALSPFYGGDLEASAWFSMEIGAALWAALTVIPVYLFTKEMFGRKSAYLAAFFIAFMPGNVERTPLGFSDHDAFFMFFIVTGFFFMLKSLRIVKTRVYVKDWRQPQDITLGLNEFMRTNKVSMLYAGMAGFALAAVALSWKGFPYALAIIFVYLLFHMLVNKFRRIDNTAIGITVLTSISIMMLVSLPYYMSMNFMHWYEAPAILYAGICLVVAVFLFTRDLPWLLILPVLLLMIVVTLSVVWFLLPEVWANIFSGAGYFIRTKLYGTIAEAQPPDFNRLVFAYGMTTFFLGMVAVMIMLKDLPKGWKNDHIFTTIWALVSMYMGIAAIRFMYNATPVFAILAGWMSWTIISKLDYKRMVRVFRSMRGDFIKAFKYSVKLRHVFGAIFVVALLVGPNVWYSYDGGVPYEFKKDHDLAIYNFLPEFMRPPQDRYDPDSNSLWYLGSFGTSFMSDYWAQGMWWLAEQDKWMPEEDRPAFISWWDYGHWCVNVGKHPTAADNFQNGVEFAGNFIAAQGEDDANALLLVRLFQRNRFNDTVVEYMRGQIGDAATDDLLDLYNDPDKFTKDVHEYPERYGLKDDEVSRKNTVFIHGLWVMKQATTEDQRVEMILWYNSMVGDSFRYFAMDSRLMPVSYQNTGIFYAPIVLSDNRVEDFIEIVALYQGNQITLDQAAALPPAERATLQYQLVWKRPFYESMFYRTFMGYSGYDQGPEFTDSGIPFVSGDLAQYPPLPAWNMSNWRVVHRTIHWNPADAENISNRPRDWEAVSYDDAKYYADNDMGVVDDAIRTVSSGVIYIKWYAGAWVNGTLLTESGKPVPGATITVHDDYRFLGGYMGPDFVGIPHGTTTTDDQGKFSILAPWGNTTIVASNGGSMEYLTLHERNTLNSTNLFIPESAAMRQGEYNFTVEMTVPTSFQEGTLFTDADSNGIYEPDVDEALANATMTVSGLQGLNVTYNITTHPDGYFQLRDAIPGDYQVSVVYKGHTIDQAGNLVLFSGERKSEDVAIPYSHISGTITRRDGGDVEGTEVTARDLETNDTVTAETDRTGVYLFDTLLAGNYSIELFVPGTRPLNETVSLTPGQEAELNLTLLPVAFLEGTVTQKDTGNRQAGGPLANTTLTFQKLWSDELVWTVTTNETGHFNTSLPTGTYTVYAHETDGEDHLAAIDIIEVNADDWSYNLELDMAPAFLVNGQIRRPASDSNETLINASRVPIQLWNNDSRIHLLSNSTGIYSIYLPEGNYSMFTFKYVLDRPRINLTQIEVDGAGVDMDEVVLLDGTRLEGNVLFDKNGNSELNPGEGIGDVNILFQALGHTFNATTLSNGSFSIVAAPLNYSVSIDPEAYEPFETTMNAEGNVLPTKQNFMLDPHNVTYTGLAGFDWNDDGNLSEDGFPDLLVTFEADDPENNPNALSINATTDAKGNYFVDLAPGTYRVKVQMDRIEDDHTYRYKHDKKLEVAPSTDNGSFNVWLNRLVRFNGTLSLEDNDTLVGTQIRIEGTSRRVTVNSGEFDDYVPVGEHLLTATDHIFLGDQGSIRYELEHLQNFSIPVSLDLVMKRVVQFSGVIYYDSNENGEFDPTDEFDPESEGEEVYVFRFTLQGIRDHDGIPAQNASFEEQVPPNDNYTLLITHRDSDPVTNAEIQWFFNGTVNLTSDTYMEIPLERRMELRGKVFWDQDEDEAPGLPESIRDALVTIEATDGSITYETETGIDGEYRQFVRIGVDGNGTYTLKASSAGYEPDQDFWEHKINFTNRSVDLTMHPLDVTFNATTFIDQNGNGGMNRYESPVEVEYIEIWDGANLSINYVTASDENGTFSISLAPGDYNMFAWTDLEGAYLVHLGVYSVEPTDEVHAVEVPMTYGRRMSGIMYYHNQTGVNHTVDDVNLTFVQRDGKGVLPISPASGGFYTVVLPEGRYGVNGSFHVEEFGVNMTYELDEEIRMVLGDLPDADLNFTRLSQWKLDLWWDDVPVFIDGNSSYNFTVYAKNTGSENGTFDVFADVPQNWLWSAEVTNITLNMSRQTSFWMLINSSEEALATPNNILVSADPREGDDDPSTMDVEIIINQFYGYELSESELQPGFYRMETKPDGTEARLVTYFFAAHNLGNGKEVIHLTASDVLDWTIELTQKEVSLEGFEEFGTIPIEVELPNETVMRPQVIKITGVAENAPTNKTQTVDLELSFPDLTIKKKDVSGEQDGVPLEWPKDEAPAFTTLAALAAIGGAALAARRRRRGW